MVLVFILVLLIWIKYLVISDAFSTLYNQFYYLKNVCFYNVYLSAESWLATQRLEKLVYPGILPSTTLERVQKLWPSIFDRIDKYTYVFQFTDLMVLDSTFSEFFDRLLNENNCDLIANQAVYCNDDFSQEIFSNSFRASVAFNFINFKKLDLIFSSNNTSGLFKENFSALIDFGTTTAFAYKLGKKGHENSRRVRAEYTESGCPLFDLVRKAFCYFCNL